MSSLFLHLQIIAGHSNDRLTLAFAQKLEMKFGGYVPPCEIIRWLLAVTDSFIEEFCQ